MGANSQDWSSKNSLTSQTITKIIVTFNLKSGIIYINDYDAYFASYFGFELNNL